MKLKRKILSLVAAAATICSLWSIPVFASDNANSTTALLAKTTDPNSGTYVIYDQNDMTNFVSYVNAGRNTEGLTFEINGTGKTYNVTDVIAPQSSTTVGSATTSSPYIKASGVGFKGTFEGNGNTINVSISTTHSGTGLFGYLAPEGKIHNLNVTGSVSVGTTSNLDAIGGVVGYNSGVIDYVTNSATVYGTNSYNIGGIAGFNNGYYNTSGGAASSGAVKGYILNCVNTSTATITGKSKAGGITGENAGLIDSCSNGATIVNSGSGKNGAGGIAGRNGNNNTAVEKGIIRNCFNTGYINGNYGKWIGGGAGFQNSKSSISYFYNTGNLAGNSYRDHTVGQNEGTLTYCFGLDTVTGDQNYDGTIEVTDAQLKGTAVYPAGSTTHVIDFLNALNAWNQTTGSYPTLKRTATGSGGTTGTSTTQSAFFVNTSTGHDTTETTGTSSDPFLTLEHAVDVANTSTASSVTITLQDNAYTFSSNAKLFGNTNNGSPIITIQAATAPSTALLTVSSGANVIISGLNVVNSNGTAVLNQGGLAVRNNSSISGKTGIRVAYSGSLEVNYSSITGSTNALYLVSGSACQMYANTEGGQSISVNGTVYLGTDVYIMMNSGLANSYSSGTYLTVNCSSVSSGRHILRSTHTTEGYAILSNLLGHVAYANSSASISNSVYDDTTNNCYAIRLG